MSDDIVVVRDSTIWPVDFGLLGVRNLIVETGVTVRYSLFVLSLLIIVD